MAHYAILNADNIVERVITGRDEDEPTPAGVSSWEEYYSDQWGKRVLRTSYNTVRDSHRSGGTPFRGDYAGPGVRYDDDLDAFIPVSPHASWVFDRDSYEWVAPIAYPDDGGSYFWDESAANWAASG